MSSLTIDKTDFTRGLADARAEGAKGVHVPVVFDISQASVSKAVSTSRRLFAASPVTVAVTFGISQASVSRALTASRALFTAKPLAVPVSFSVSQAAVTRAMATARALFAARPLVVPVSFSVSAASVTKTVASARALFAAKPVTVPVSFSTAGMATATAAAAGLATATTAAGNAARSTHTAWGALTGVLTKQIPLFGLMKGEILASDSALTGFLKTIGNSAPHILSAVAGWHLMADWAIEFSAVLIPAGIALAAFGLAALGPLRQIYTQMKDINTVSQATGKNIPPLTDSFSKLQAAVKPQVYQLFGDVLSVMGSRSGALTTLATGTGHALDVLGARMAVAITQGKGMGGVLAGGAADVAKLGDIVGNFGGTLGNVLKAMPGYAEIFLNLWDAVSKGAEALTAATIPILKVGLALHGFIVYAGLAVTAVLKLGPPVAKLAGTLYDLGLKSAASLGAFALDLVEADGAMAKFAVVGAALGAVDPLIWVAAAAAGLVGLALWLRNSRTAAQQFNAAMQQTITNAPTISAGIADMGVAAHLTSQKLADAETSLARVSAAAMKAGGTAQLSQADKGSAAYLRAAAATRVYASGLQQVTAQQSLSDSRLGRLKQTYGSSTAALGALTAAGVTNAQWQQRGANGWAIIAQMVTATTAAYKIMGVSTGAAGNDLQILGNQASQSYTAIQTLNTGLDAFIGNLTKTQGSFDTLALGNVTLRDNFSKANEAAKLTTHTLGGVKTGSTLAGAAMDGLSQASLTLNQAFGTQVSNVEALLDTWRVAGIAQNLQTQGTKDAIAPLLKYAAGSQEARAQLAGLAEEAGFNLAPTLRNLTGWLGNTHGATQKLKDITNQATLQEALLTSGMQAQGQYIASTLIGDINTAILKYHGVASAASAYGTAMAHFGPQSTQATTALDLMNQKIIASGRAMGDTTGQIAAMIAKLDKIPLKKAIEIVVSGDGSFSVKQVTSLHTGPGGKQTALAAGGRLSGYGGGDRRPALLEDGETVVSKESSRMPFMVSAFRAAKVPGYSAGGVAGAYSGALPGEGRWAVTEYGQAVTSIEKAVASATAAAIRAGASRAARSAAGSGVAAPPGSTGPGPAAAQAWMRAHMGDYAWSQSQFPSLVNLWNGESGWRWDAQNPTSPAYGIPQADPGDKMAAAGADWRTNPVTQMRWGAEYIRETPGYGTPGATYEKWLARSPHWYASGTAGAAPGWAKVGERGTELVRMRGGETVLPHSVTSRVLSGGVQMPGYAGGTPDVQAPGGGSGGHGKAPGTGYRAQLARDQKRLAAMQARASAHVRTLRVPIEKEELYLLEHPHLAASARKAREAALASREKALRKYRRSAVAGESVLQKEIRLLTQLIAGEHHRKVPIGKLPPGVGAGGSRKKDLGELAKLVTSLGALKKKAGAHVTALRRPVDSEELYLLQHPGLSASVKAAIEAKIRRGDAAIARYRKTTGAEESTYSREISLLRSLTGDPAAAKYGGAGGSGSARALPPPSFLSGAGGSGGFSTAPVTPGAGTQAALAATPAADATPGAGTASYGPAAYTPAVLRSATIAPAASHAPAVPASPAARALAASIMAPGDSKSAAQVIALLKQIVAELAAAPARTSEGVARGVNGIGRGALNRGYYS